MDGQGVNIGRNFGVPFIRYGDHPDLEVDVGGERIIVSHSDFALIDVDESFGTHTYAAFFPGIVPDHPTQPVPLLELFAGLETVDFDRVADLAAVDGRIYMTLSGENGLYLFGAHDPSVIPEPSTVALAVAILMLVVGRSILSRRTWWERRPCRTGLRRAALRRSMTYAVLTCIVLLGTSARVAALPPLGLTSVGPLFGRSVEASVGELEIIGGSAYISANGPVWQVESSGQITRFDVNANDVTRVVEGLDGEVYVGGTMRAGPSVGIMWAGLYRLDEPAADMATWWQVNINTGERPWIVGIDRNLRGVGNIVLGEELSAAAFHGDGSFESLEPPFPSGSAHITHVSASGHALGRAELMDFGIFGVELWRPDGSSSMLTRFGSGVADSLRDRLDGQGVNIGYRDGRSPVIKYGDQPEVEIDVSAGRAIVSQSDFAVIDTGLGPESYAAFFPGIVPEDPTQAVRLFDVFPELETLNFHQITDLAAVDGRIYMTLRRGDAAYLFGAHDPSVIPEPSTVAIALLAVTVLGGRVVLTRHRYVQQKTG